MKNTSTLIRAFTLGILVAIMPCLSASAQSWQWARGAGGVSYDNATKIATDLQKNIYATGYFSSGFVNFGSYTLFNTDSGTSDIFLVKYDSLGNVLWAKSAGGAGYDYAAAITTDPNGGVYVAGYFMSPSISFDTFTLTNSGTGTIYLVKYDTAGNVQWAKKGTGNYIDYANALHCTATGTILLCGQFGSSFLQFDSVTMNNTGGEDFFLAAFSQAGTLAWAHCSVGDGVDNAHGITSDPAGNVYICGSYDGSFLSFDATVIYNDSAGTEAMFVARYDSSGNFNWVTTAGETGGTDAVGIAADDSGHIYVAGNFGNNLTFDSVTSFTAGGTNDIFMVKYDTAANRLWVQTAGGAGADVVQSISLDIFDNVYIAGYYSSATISFGGYTLPNAGGYDVFFARYNNQGLVYGAARAGGVSDDFGQCVASDVSGNVYMAGSYESSSIVFAGTTLLNAGGATGTTDIFLAKYFDPLVQVPTISNTSGQLSLYPNPNSGAMTLAGLPSSVAQVQIYDCLGRLVFSKSTSGTNTLSINQKGLVAGVYTLRVNSCDGAATIAFVVGN